MPVDNAAEGASQGSEGREDDGTEATGDALMVASGHWRAPTLCASSWSRVAWHRDSVRCQVSDFTTAGNEPARSERWASRSCCAATCRSCRASGKHTPLGEVCSSDPINQSISSRAPVDRSAGNRPALSRAVPKVRTRSAGAAAGFQSGQVGQKRRPRLCAPDCNSLARWQDSNSLRYTAVSL